MRQGVLFLLAMALTMLVLAPAALAAYPGANGNILFDNADPADPALPGPDIFTFNGGVAHDLTPSSPLSDLDPIASGNGRRIVFESNRSGGEVQIYSMNSDGSDLTQLTADPEGAFYPTISPDGSHVAFTHGGSGAQLSIMRSDGSDVRQLMPIAGGASMPSIGEPIFDQTGASLIFFGSVRTVLPGCPYCHTERYELDAINSDGSGLRHLADFERFYNLGRKPTLSPDGSTIAFSGRRPEDSSSEIYTMKINGSDVTRLTNNSAGDFSPAFSPDGKEILFQTDRGGSEDIYVMQRDGSDQRPMYASSGTEENPEWAPSTLTCDHKQVTVLSTPGNDKLVGTSQDDVIIGGGGSDRITSGSGNDTICSGKGDDTITAGAGDDRLWGVAGADTLLGRSGGDFLNGGPGHDICSGAGGTDRGKLCEHLHLIP